MRDLGIPSGLETTHLSSVVDQLLAALEMSGPLQWPSV